MDPNQHLTVLGNLLLLKPHQTASVNEQFLALPQYHQSATSSDNTHVVQLAVGGWQQPASAYQNPQQFQHNTMKPEPTPLNIITKYGVKMVSSNTVKRTSWLF